MSTDSIQQQSAVQPAAQASSKMPWLLFVLVAVLVVLDQYSKYLCTLFLEMGLPVPVFPGFDLLLAHNEGAAFSFLDDAGGWQRWLFAAISVVVSVVLTVWLWRLPRQQQLLGVALAFILGGALGNLIDRVLLGYVVDFISIYYADWRFATFNIADAAISCGAALLVLDVVLHGANHE